MRQSTANKAILQITALLDAWLDGPDTNEVLQEFPHLPPDVAHLMAKEAVKVIEILAIGEKALFDDGLLGDGDE